MPTLMMQRVDYPRNTVKAAKSQLSINSQLKDLELYNCQIDAHCCGVEVAKVFEDDSLVPGIILTQDNQLLGIISRRQFLEFMSRPYGPELFLGRSLTTLYEHINVNGLILPGETVITSATQSVLQRSLDHLYEPIIVQLDPTTYRLLDAHQLFLAQTQIHTLTIQLLNEQTEAKLIQTEKMASLGQMIAGVAHEILNPVNFIAGNIEYLSSYHQDIVNVLAIYETEFPLATDAIDQVKDSVELDFIIQDCPRILESMKIGSERLKQIVSTLKNFSRVDETDKTLVDIHECLDNALLILHNRLKYSIQVAKNYRNIPQINCFSGQLNQVFVNLISNAADALLEQAKSSPDSDWQPQIEITTQLYPTDPSTNGGSQGVAIYVADNGPGICPEIQTQIFEAFYTTKPAGKGTGLGLSISRQIVVERHGGQLNLHSVPTKGTTFEVLIPFS